MPLWSSTAAAESTNQAVVTGHSVVLGSASGLVAVAASTGSLRWRTNEGVTILRADGGVIFYGTNTGTVGAREGASGTSKWERANVCPPSPGNGARAATALAKTANALLVGCVGGTLALFDAGTGMLRARSRAFEADQVAQIIPLGRCAYGVSGSASGAKMRLVSAIVDCRTLRVISPEQIEVEILGSIGNVAILWQCCSNPDTYRPGTVYAVDLASGRAFPRHDLRPEPQRFPPPRPVGQEAEPFLAGSDLFLIVHRTVYAYGDARAPAPIPRRVADGLVEFPLVMAGGTIAIERPGTDGRIVGEIVRMGPGPLRTLWRHVFQQRDSVRYYPSADLNVAVTSVERDETLFVRIPDGRMVNAGAPCSLLGSDAQLLIANCWTTMFGGRHYVAAYRWPATGS